MLAMCWIYIELLQKLLLLLLERMWFMLLHTHTFLLLTWADLLPLELVQSFGGAASAHALRFGFQGPLRELMMPQPEQASLGVIHFQLWVSLPLLWPSLAPQTPLAPKPEAPRWGGINTKPSRYNYMLSNNRPLNYYYYYCIIPKQGQYRVEVMTALRSPRPKKKIIMMTF